MLRPTNRMDTINSTQLTTLDTQEEFLRILAYQAGIQHRPQSKQLTTGHILKVNRSGTEQPKNTRIIGGAVGGQCASVDNSGTLPKQ